MLADVAGRRVLFDPSLSPSFSAPGVFSAPPAARDADALGPVDVVCISSGEVTALDVRTLDALSLRGASVFVGDDDTARRVRQRGLRRVRVLRPGQPVDVVGLRIEASPARGLVGEAIGFTVHGPGTPGLWHTGPLPPLEVDARAASFASAHPVDVVLGCAWGLTTRAGGPPLAADLDDVAALARIARAHVLLPIGADADVAGVFRLGLERPVPTSTTTPSTPSAPTTTTTLRIERPVRGTWYGLGPAAAASAMSAGF